MSNGVYEYTVTLSFIIVSSFYSGPQGAETPKIEVTVYSYVF